MTSPAPDARDTAGLRAGAALLAAGHWAAARTAWARAGAADDPLVLGLVWFASAAERAASGEPSASTVQRAADVLDDVADSPVDPDPLLAFLDALAAGEPSASPNRITVDGEPVDPEGLALEALERATSALGAAEERYDEAVLADAVRYAREESQRGRAAFGSLLTDIVTGRREEVAYARLRQHVERRRNEERDVDGLFDDRSEGSDAEEDTDGA